MTDEEKAPYKEASSGDQKRYITQLHEFKEHEIEEPPVSKIELRKRKPDTKNAEIGALTEFSTQLKKREEKS